MALLRIVLHPLSLSLLAGVALGCASEAPEEVDTIAAGAPEEEPDPCNCKCKCSCPAAESGSDNADASDTSGTGNPGDADPATTSGTSSTGTTSGTSSSGSSSSTPTGTTTGGNPSSTTGTATGGNASSTTGATSSGNTTPTTGTGTGGSTSVAGTTGTGNPSASGGAANDGDPSASGAGADSTNGTEATGGASTEGTPFIVPDDAQPTPESSGVDGTFRVTASGQLTANGTPFQLRGGNWFGLEGQDDIARPGAMELYIGSVSWADASNTRSLAQTMQEIAAAPLSFNTIRLPIAPQTLIAGHQDGDYTRTDVRIRNNNAELYPYGDAWEALKDFIVQADENGLYVILDIHSCSNHIGWRAGMIHDGPPWTDANRENYEYKKEDYTCRSGEDEYTVEKWLADVRTLAKLPKDLGVDNVLGIDCFNEPFKYTWSEWADLAKQCYDAMASENDDLIAFVEGVSGSWEDEEGNKGDEPYGDKTTNPNWGENLYGQQFDPIQIPRDRLCFAPHTYGPSVYVQKQFVDQSDPDCVGLEDDEAGKTGCSLVVERSNAAVVEKLRAGWDARFGYLVDQGYCVMIGEFGGYRTWPDNPVDPDAKTIWAHLPSNVQYDWEWQNIFVEYLKDKGLTNFTYWSINPESGDTGGIYNHAYSESNESGWGVWQGFDTEKTALLSALR